MKRPTYYSYLLAYSAHRVFFKTEDAYSKSKAQRSAFLHWYSLLLLTYSFFSFCTPEQSILELVQKNNITIVRCFFTDLLSNLKEITISCDHLESALQKGLYFDGSSIPGYSNIYDSDMHLILDQTSFKVVNIDQSSFGIIFCTIEQAENTPYNICARATLQQALQKASSCGYGVSVGAEIEFFLFDHDYNPCDNRSYCDTTTCPTQSLHHRQLMRHLQQYGINVEKFHHEVAPGQYEISIHYTNPLKMADSIILAKHVIQEWAMRNNMQVSFMPKPFSITNGSGMHIHFSIYDIATQQNLFYDPTDQYLLSKTAYYFIAGVLKHIHELDILFNSTINSFKRLVVGYEAPVYICWASKNRSALIRIPEFDSQSPQAARAELRNPDALCNPYLAFTALLHMGLNGIEHQISIPESINRNLYKLSSEEIFRNNIQTLPSSLAAALEAFESSIIALTIFGSQLCSEFAKAKMREIENFTKAITNWEWQSNQKHKKNS